MTAIVKLKKMELKKEADPAFIMPYYLSLEYEIERMDGIYKLELPKVELPILNNDLTIDTNYEYGACVRKLIIGDNQALHIMYDEDGKAYKETLIKKKTRKMTLEEIEKELGYKVEVVSKK